MNSSSVIIGAWVLCIAISGGGSGGGGHCDTIAFQPGLSLSWIIPPKTLPSSVDDRSAPLASIPNSFDPRNESPVTQIGGYGHPPFLLRHSHEQLSLPNEFLITSNGPQQAGGGVGSDGGGGGGGDGNSRGLSPMMPLFQQLDPVDCDGGPSCPNVDISQQQRPTTIYQSNIASVPAIAPPEYQQQHRSRSPFAPVPVSVGQPVGWPNIHGGGIGLLFFVPESASHLPVEQLIRQQLALHRTQLPFDISINCEDGAVGSGCRPAAAIGGAGGAGGGGGFSLPATMLDGRNSENRNYASLPLVEIDSGSSRRGGLQQQQRKWRTVGERIVRLQQKQQQQQQQSLPQQKLV